jgi:hypothetical protein
MSMTSELSRRRLISRSMSMARKSPRHVLEGTPDLPTDEHLRSVHCLLVGSGGLTQSSDCNAARIGS